jgi:phenylacetate-CoA ligase
LIERFRPVLIDGYAESFNFLAQYLSSGRQLKHQPRAIMSSAQTLTAQTRSEIEAAFGCQVYDKYGAREFSGVAYQCGESGNYHVMDESYIVEILGNGKPAAPGEIGEIVVTDLNNYSFPLIRYRIGDLAVAAENTGSCPCGRGLSMIGPIQGRTQALVHCANNRWLPGTFFAHFFKDYSHTVRHFQIEQHEKSSFSISIVPGNFWNEFSAGEILSALKPHIGFTDVRFEVVSEIPLLETGKRTPVISSLRIDFQTINNA